MIFKLPNEYRQKKQEEYEKQYVIHNDKEIHVSEFEDKSITVQYLSEMRMNSYAREKIYPKFDNSALINDARYYMSQCGRYNYPAATYNEALIHVIVPELINRIEELEKEIDLIGR